MAATNGLPPHLSLDEVPEATPEFNFKHQWLYSVVPVSRKFESWSYNSDGTNNTSIEFPLVPFLTGFCRVCGKAFSQEIPMEGEYYNNTGKYLETIMDIPQWGCADPTTVVG